MMKNGAWKDEDVSQVDFGWAPLSVPQAAWVERSKNSQAGLADATAQADGGSARPCAMCTDTGRRQAAAQSQSLIFSASSLILVTGSPADRSWSRAAIGCSASCMSSPYEPCATCRWRRVTTSSVWGGW